MKPVVCLLIFATFVGHIYSKKLKCNNAADCKDPDGRTVCWSNHCYSTIPCNKDDDCYFYGSANVPRFRCYKVPNKPWPKGYGTCVEERIGDPLFERVPEDYDAWRPE